MQENRSTIHRGELSVLSPSEIEELEKNLRFYTTSGGTRLAFHEYGDPRGRPIFFYHGTGSHLQATALHKPGLRQGFRIIAPDRPGVSHSEFRKGWTPLEYARDMTELADFLGISTFGALGISGGGPTLLASAFAVPERLDWVVDLACATPVYGDSGMRRHLGKADRFYAVLGTRLPLGIFRIPFSFLGLLQTFFKSPSSFAKMFDSSLCPADKELFQNPDFQYLIMRDFQELYRHGSLGPAYDAQTVYRAWGFDIASITKPVEIFQGSSDKFVPPKFSEYLAEKNPRARLHILEGMGHFGHLAYGYDMLERLKEL
ncbi:MAG TPA: alpha/beta hydrolase [Synergistaceae bacterium]|nr:alpha/beta hydrolase [Synergistaceae bacterium]